MIGLDTDVPVRIIVADDPAQADRARRAMEARGTEAAPGFVSLIVLCEPVWTLRRTFRLPRRHVVEALTRLAGQTTLCLEQPAAVAEALDAYRHTAVDFADALIDVVSRGAGCNATLTFDRRAAARLPGFEVI